MGKTYITTDDNKKFDWFSRTDNNINRLGYGMLYTNIEKEETGMAEKQI